jgi:glycosyltransferase involved in cell wall biosynthesis
MLARLIEASHRRREFHHVVVSLTSAGDVGARLRNAGIELHTLGFRYSLGAFKAFWRLRKLLRELRPDVVQTWMYHADLIGGLAARGAGSSAIAWGVRSTFMQFEGSRFTRVVARACAMLSTRIPRVIVCAAEASRRVHVEMGYDAARMRVIPNGFDISRLAGGADRRADRRAEFGFDARTVAIGAIGRFSPVKDYPTFIEACAIVGARMPFVRFLLAGRGLDAENRELVNRLEKAGLRDRFVLLGERNDIPECLAALDVFCLSSRSEGFPNVVGEAMGAGVPCVVTDVGDAALLVGDTGEVVAPGDPQALGAALLRIAGYDPDTRQARGAAARRRIEREYSLDATCARYESLYRELAAGANH